VCRHANWRKKPDRFLEEVWDSVKAVSSRHTTNPLHAQSADSSLTEPEFVKFSGIDSKDLIPIDFKFGLCLNKIILEIFS
jgi:hypothetical protein